MSHSQLMLLFLAGTLGTAGTATAAGAFDLGVRLEGVVFPLFAFCDFGGGGGLGLKGLFL